MRGFALLAAVTVLTALASPPALGDEWYIPIVEQVPAGFDHIQILMAYPYKFANPALYAFCGPSPVAEDWSQTYFGCCEDFATADGPSPGSEAIHFAIGIAGDRQTDRPAFHFQAYLGDTLVDDANFTCFGPGEKDWMIGFGTWGQNSPAPPFLPGDANRDAQVSLGDLGILAGNYGTDDGSACWCKADFNGDGNVSLGDLGILAGHWGEGTTGAPAAPEPATITLTALGAAAVMAAGKRKR